MTPPVRGSRPRSAVLLRPAARRQPGLRQPVDVRLVTRPVVVAEVVLRGLRQVQGAGEERRHLAARDLAVRAEPRRRAAERDALGVQPRDVLRELRRRDVPERRLRRRRFDAALGRVDEDRGEGRAREAMRSTRPVIPSTAPLEVYCQNVQPKPAQSDAGTVGLPAVVQWATHTTR